MNGDITFDNISGSTWNIADDSLFFFKQGIKYRTLSDVRLTNDSDIDAAFDDLAIMRIGN